MYIYIRVNIYIYIYIYIYINIYYIILYKDINDHVNLKRFGITYTLIRSAKSNIRCSEKEKEADPCYFSGHEILVWK